MGRVAEQKATGEKKRGEKKLGAKGSATLSPHDLTVPMITEIRSRQKYRNHAQLLQGVSQVDAELTQGERLLLLTLAVFNVKTDPHPGNEKLARACGITSRQGVNHIVNKIISKQLIEIVEVGNGRGKATVYRIRTEDPRFPWPEKREKHASPDLHVSEKKPASDDLSLPAEKPASGSTRNPQVSDRKPASLDLHTDLNTRKQTRRGAVFESVVHTRTSTNTDSEPARDDNLTRQTDKTATAINLFWDAYPTAKNYPSIPVSVMRAWAEIDGDDHLGEILDGLECWKNSDQWQTARFVKHPDNFLIEKTFLVTPPSSKAAPRFDHRKLKRL